MAQIQSFLSISHFLSVYLFMRFNFSDEFFMSLLLINNFGFAMVQIILEISGLFVHKFRSS